MLGVQLRATWTQTRKVNGDTIQERVSKSINSWKAGKFMPLTMRPWSLNSFVLSKVVTAQPQSQPQPQPQHNKKVG